MYINRAILCVSFFSSIVRILLSFLVSINWGTNIYFILRLISTWWLIWTWCLIWTWLSFSRSTLIILSSWLVLSNRLGFIFFGKIEILESFFSKSWKIFNKTKIKIWWLFRISDFHSKRTNFYLFEKKSKQTLLKDCFDFL